MQTNDKLKNRNQIMCELFVRSMHREDQRIPTAPTIRDLNVRILRAKLILEEAFEVIEKGLGLKIGVSGCWISAEDLNYGEARPVNLVELADGLADLEVVGPCGTASAFGIALQPIYDIVAGNNLLKFAPGHKFNESGKLVKPPNHPSPTNDIYEALMAQNPDRDARTSMIDSHSGITMSADDKEMSGNTCILDGLIGDGESAVLFSTPKSGITSLALDFSISRTMSGQKVLFIDSDVDAISFESRVRSLCKSKYGNEDLKILDLKILSCLDYMESRSEGKNKIDEIESEIEKRLDKYNQKYHTIVINSGSGIVNKGDETHSEVKKLLSLKDKFGIRNILATFYSSKGVTSAGVGSGYSRLFDAVIHIEKSDFGGIYMYCQSNTRPLVKKAISFKYPIWKKV